MSQRTFFGINAHRVRARDPLFGKGKPKLSFFAKDGSRIPLDKRTKARVKRIDPKEIEARRGDWEGRAVIRDDRRYALERRNPHSVASKIKAPITTAETAHELHKPRNTLKVSEFEYFRAIDPNREGDVRARHEFK